MPDQLTVPPPPPVAAAYARGYPWREQWRALVLQAASVVVLFVALAAAAGLLVERLWDAPTGMVYQHHWQRGLVSLHPLVLAENADQGVFDGIGWFVVVAAVLGLVLGAVVAFLLDRSELVTLAAVMAGGVLGGLVMYAVAVHAAPPDPSRLARTASQGTVLPDTLRLGSRWIVLALPGGALASLAAVFLLVGRRRAGLGRRVTAEAGDGDGPRRPERRLEDPSAG